MKLLISIAAMLMNAAPLYADAMSSKPPATEQQDWQLVWSDEFEGDQIDSSKWGYDTDCWGGGNNEKQCYTDKKENAQVADGYLSIIARKETSVGPAWPAHLRETMPEEEKDKTAEKPYTSARLLTKGKADWKYGRIEVRAKLPEGQGIWPAIWMLPSEEIYGKWAASGEIDILEAVNLGAFCENCPDQKENKIFGTLHFGGEWPHNHHKGNATPLTDSADGFHVFAIEWKEGEIIWFLDGEEYSRLGPDDWNTTSELAKNNPAAPFDQKFFLILNIAVGGHLSEEQNERGIAKDGFPKTMMVDWVRIYQKK